MTEDEVSIANAALIHIGADPITDFAEEERTEAKTVAARYESVRDALLRSYKWNFAMRFAALPGRALSPERFGFTHEFDLPAGRPDDPLPYCLRLWATDADPYKVAGRKVLTKKSGPLGIAYAARVATVNEFDAIFSEVLALDLALSVVNKIGSSEQRDRAKNLMLERRRLFREARLADAMEQTPEPIAPNYKSSWLHARRRV